ncbi:MAG TPA: response regulator transcription factor [Thermomicrobiales bacterium]|nr:response regulator transcription factor [Thermomicrobiales bacterium]
MHEHILIVDDEPQLLRFLRATLAGHGYAVATVADGEAALAELRGRLPDLVLLDLGLPGMDGLEVCRRLREAPERAEWATLPVVVLSARDQEGDKVAALDLGADDYLTKPFGVGELLARIRVALRHAARREGRERVFVAGDLRVDFAARRVTVAGAEVHLTPTEYALLTYLATHAGKVATHRLLLNAVWGPGYTDDPGLLRVYVNQLRRKLEADPARPRLIVTDPGVGYRLVAGAEPGAPPKS